MTADTEIIHHQTFPSGISNQAVCLIIPYYVYFPLLTNCLIFTTSVNVLSLCTKDNTVPRFVYQVSVLFDNEISDDKW